MSRPSRSRLVKFLVGALGDAAAVASEEGSWCEVDDSAWDDPGGVSGKAGVPFRLEVALELQEELEYLAEEVFFFFGGEVHVDVVEGAFDEEDAPGFGVGDRVFVEAALDRFATAVAFCADEEWCVEASGAHVSSSVYDRYDNIPVG